MSSGFQKDRTPEASWRLIKLPWGDQVGESSETRVGGRQSGKQAAGARDGRMGSTAWSRNPRTGHPEARALGDSLNWDGEGRGKKGI